MRTPGLAIAFLLALTAHAQPPRVVHASPDHGDIAVPSTLPQIRIEFDQDMNAGGRSICGGGDSFPEFTGPPRWESPRVLIIPVALKASHEYHLSLNCPSARKFRSKDGQPAEITPISFRTAPADAPPAVHEPLTPAANDAAIAALRKAIDQRYSYRDRLVKDWDAAFGPHLASMRDASTPAAFARAAARALAPAEDVHVSLAVNHASFGTNTTGARLNFDPRVLEATLKEFARHNGTVSTGRVENGAAYILITSWPGDAAQIQPALDALDRFKDAPSLIIDVRPNGGGDESTARTFAARFVDKPTVYSRDHFRDPSSDTGWGPMLDRVINPDPNSPRFTKPVAVLIGQACCSSNESFILMMKHGANATLVGETSRGSSGNPRTHDLGNGVSIRLPSWQDFLPDGTLLEGRGIDPDLGVREPVTPAGDLVLRGAINALSH
ncbi:Carboxy-terminal processing protease CtpA [Phycisphaerales bacterium]|nr:Carboxy-terminal processing protease CtpA [Phycisphaerales bacterium]